MSWQLGAGLDRMCLAWKVDTLEYSPRDKDRLLKIFILPSSICVFNIAGKGTSERVIGISVSDRYTAK